MLSTLKQSSITVALLVVASFIACTIGEKKTEAPINNSNILIIAHRGASGHRPEHTLAAYDLAIEMGADFIEPDLVMTKDGVLIARHENEISETTDVARKFPKRKRKRKIDGRNVNGWFSEDFTLQEIKTLRTKERLPGRNQSFNGQFEVPTLSEIIDLVQKRSKEKNRIIGIYPETKHPSYFESIGLPLELALAKELIRVGWNRADSPVIIQSFELSSLRKMKSLVGCRLVFLLDEATARPFDLTLKGEAKTYGDYLKPNDLKALASWLYGIGPWKRLIVPENEKGELQGATTLVEDAHHVGLKVHPYTFRSDASFLAKSYSGDAKQEYRQFLELGVDGFFTDFPDDAHAALRAMSESK